MISQFLLSLKVVIKQVISPFGQQKLSDLVELTIGHLRYYLADVPPQPNSLPNIVYCKDQSLKGKHIGFKTNLYVSHTPQNKWNEIKSSGISKLPKLPLILHPPGHWTESD